MLREARSRVFLAGSLACWPACSGDGSDGTTSPTTGSSSSASATPTTGPAPTTSETDSSPTSSSTAALDDTGDLSTSDPSTDSESGPPPADMGSAACLPATQPCDDPAQCCQDQGLTCDTTTLGQVCCGLEGTSCATANGEDCCGDLLCIAGTCLGPNTVPPFKAPYPCGQSWTYSHHDQEVRRALDFVDNGGNTDGAPCLAALAGIATRHVENGAGNYIVVDHGSGWTTYYFHLQAFSVEDGAYVQQGQEVGKVGSTGNSSGAHIHFEELRYGEGQDIWLEGKPLAPYPGTYGQASLISGNCP